MSIIYLRKYEASGDLSDLISRRDDPPPDELAAIAKQWRRGARAEEAARLLGLPKSTYDFIEQGRGFRYPRLLLLAMRDLKPHGRWR